MMISDNMKSSYDVIGQKVNGKVVVVHESTSSSMRSSYDSEEEFNKDKSLKGLRGIVLESVNG